MTDELKANLDDCKDLAQQAKLEMKIRSRDSKTDETVGDRLKNAGNFAQQMAIEARRKTRNAALAVKKSTAKHQVDGVLSATSDAVVDTKDNLIDAVAPPTDEEIARREQRKEVERAQREQEVEQERKRQELVDSVKAKSAAVGAKVSAGAQAISAALKQVAGQAEIMLGKAALQAKDKLDDYTDDGPRTETKAARSARGVDISSVQNIRNDELQQKEARVAEIERAQEPTLLEQAKKSLTDAADSVKDAYEEATTDPKLAVFIAQTSAGGVDISHVENPNNAELAQREETRLKEERAATQVREKAVVEGQVKDIVDPMKQGAKEEAHSLKETLVALGDSLVKATHKLSDNLTAKYGSATRQETTVTHPAMSARGVDVSAIENAENERLGEEIRANQREEELPKGSPKDSTQDKIIRSALDAGVVVQEKGRQVDHQAEHAANELKYQAKIAAAEADIQAQEINAAAQQKGHEVNLKAAALKEKALELGDQAAVKATELQATVQTKAHDASLKVQDLTHQAGEKMSDLKVSVGEKLHATKEKLSAGGAPSTESHERPTLIRLQAVEELPTASPITPSMQQPLVLNIQRK